MVQKSCTTWDVWNPVNNENIYCINWLAGFCPSTVWNVWNKTSWPSFVSDSFFFSFTISHRPPNCSPPFPFKNELRLGSWDLPRLQPIPLEATNKTPPILSMKSCLFNGTPSIYTPNKRMFFSRRSSLKFGCKTSVLHWHDLWDIASAEHVTCRLLQPAPEMKSLGEVKKNNKENRETPANGVNTGWKRDRLGRMSY